ncbi:hypothetical protein M8C13_43200 [Crossiella sp. SN42]|uniref:hypothetical protein n=1 Tax=Crossiella sp. SN42 TaxID=2944808 RepID=UPI00207D3730|nr:hypothetical protein [Crossiella sp. SN42]MCO1582574.1 hypothetical protein [Crossiella sp. SN42]
MPHTLTEALAVATDWLTGHAAGEPGFGGAYLAGSAAALALDAVAADFAAPRWVRRRCARAEARIRAGLDAARAAAPWPDRVLRWLFATGVSTHVLLTAALRDPTIRLRYAATGTLLAELGRPEWQEELLAALGCAHLTPERVRQHLGALTVIFDEAAQAVEAAANNPVALPFYASDLSREARPIAIDGAHELIEAGLHREAVFWLLATYARALNILGRDGDEAFSTLLADLGNSGPADLRTQIGRTEEFLPRLAELREAVLTSVLSRRFASGLDGPASR